MSSDPTLERLERVTARLEQLETRLKSNPVFKGDGAPVPLGSAPTGSAGAPTKDAAFVAAFDDLLKEHLSPVIEKSKACGPDVEKIAQEFHNALLAQRQMLVVASKCKKPTDETVFQKWAPSFRNKFSFEKCHVLSCALCSKDSYACSMQNSATNIGPHVEGGRPSGPSEQTIQPFEHGRRGSHLFAMGLH
jgi:hypothetical protein